MNYFKHYYLLIKRAKDREYITCYKEKHHIFPVSIFGENDKIVYLTAREHVIAHKLLYYIFKLRYGINHRYTKKAGMALRMMCTMKTSRHSGRVITKNSRCIALMREINAIGMRGDLNPAKSEISRRKISVSKQGKERPDMKGKSYMGGDRESSIEKSKNNRNENIRRRKEQGLKGINVKPGQKRKPHTEQRKKSISLSRPKILEKWKAMTREEFSVWLRNIYLRGTLYRKTGLGGNVVRALNARNENYEEYKEYVERETPGT